MSRRFGRTIMTTLLWACIIGCQKSEAPGPAPTAPAAAPAAPAPEPAKCIDCIPVTVENFPRAESDLYFQSPIKQAGGIGKFYHYREVMPIDKQTVVRANR